MSQNITGIILAAGKGTRMNSPLPKVLHDISGQPMISWVFDALEESDVKKICLILSEDLDGFEPFLAKHEEILVAIQSNRLGTGDAVASAAFAFNDVALPPYAAGRLHQGQKASTDAVLICAGDVPAIQAESLKDFLRDSQGSSLSVLGMRVPDPTGYGRLVVKDGNQLDAIVEEKDADEAIRKITLCNSGIIYAKAEVLFELLSELDNKNSSEEYYLTDCFKLARERGISTHVHVAKDHREFAGVNTQDQLKLLEEWMVTREA